MRDYGSHGFGMYESDRIRKGEYIGDEYGAYRRDHLRSRYDDDQEVPKRYVPIILLPLIVLLTLMGLIGLVFYLLL